MTQAVLTSDYSRSWAILVGIDTYEHAPPLIHAAADARSILDILLARFDFQNEDVTLLLDDEATRDRILEAYLALAASTAADDRVLVFFAGHGHTVSSSRGEVGYLVPKDGDPQRLHTLIRWDELTRNADLIPAKHVFFMMDACYGGLAIQRALPAGSTRYLKDMLRRPVRQALTAGKGDEVVSDAGGPVAGHSVFTGFVLLGLQGEAATPDGIISANSLMPYVYQRVSRNDATRQTPHYGYLGGDGDFVFNTAVLKTLTEHGASSDVLIQVPADSTATHGVPEDLATTAKSLLSDPASTIHLYDLTAFETRQAISRIESSRTQLMAGSFSVEEFSARLELYDELSRRLQVLAAVIARWGHTERLQPLGEMLARMADFSTNPRSGNLTWIALEWFPVMLTAYASGIAAMHAGNWEALAALLDAASVGTYRAGDTHSLPLVLGRVCADLHESFRLLPERDRQFVPRSEYLFGRLQPLLDDLLFLGGGYERAFDRFEAFFALAHADLNLTEQKHDWAPPGRYAYKYAQRDRYRAIDPLSELLREASAAGADWPPLKQGLFGGSITRVEEAAKAITRHIPESWGL
jgi:hypothetical protein